MKIFIYDESRVLIRTVGTPDVMQGENNATLIFMSVAGIDQSNFQNYLAQFAATIGTSHPTDIITDFGPYVLDGVTYYGWKYFVSSKFTQVAGVLNANLVLSSNGSTLISQTVALNVNPSASGVTWFKNITEAQWEQLLAYCIGLRNPNLGVVDTSADPNILDDYNSEAQLGAYLFVEAQNGNLCLLTVGYDDNDEAIIQNVLSVHGSALYISSRMYEDGEWTAWTTADGASAISVQASHFQRIPSTANKVQSALQALDELMPNNFILADDYCVNLAGQNLSNYGYTFTQSGNDYIIGLPSGENINDWLWRMCGVRRIIPSPTIFDDPVTIVTKKGAVFTMYKSGANYILKAQVTFVLYDDFKGFVDDLGESVTTKSLLVKNGSITNLRVNSTQFLANEGGNTHLINSTEHTFTDKGNTYKFPYPSGTTQTDAEKKLATLQMILDLSDQSDGRYVHDFDMSLDEDYVLTITLKDYDGNTLRTRTVDFPAEMAMVGASYDNVTKDLTFTLQNGNTVTVPLDDIISGLATETYVTNAISTALADYVTASALNTALSSYTTLSYATATFALIGDSYTKAESDAKYALDTDLTEANAKITSLETKTAKQESDIQYLYRQVIGGGDLVTATDSGVSLTSQPFPLTVSPKALLNYIGGMCQKVGDSIITAPVTTVVSKGFNLWNEQWELGGYNSSTGEKVTESDRIRNKNPISVLPSTSYYFKKGGSGYIYAYYYDKDMNFIGQEGATNSIVTTPNNCRYVNFYCSSSYGTTYNHDICINVSSSLNGTYMPYRAPIEYPIPAEVRALEGYGYGLSAECYNGVSYEGKSYDQAVARAVLSSLPWQKEDASTNLPSGHTFSVRVSNFQVVRKLLTAIESKYISSASSANTQGVLYYGHDYYALVYGDENISTVQELVASFGEKDIFYELATPVETDISEYIDSDVIEVTAGGSLEFENEDDMGVPYSTTYQCEPETQEGE